MEENQKVTKEEMAELFKVIYAAYQRFEIREGMLELWMEVFQKAEYADLRQALVNHIRYSSKEPSIAEIRECLGEVYREQRMKRELEWSKQSYEPNFE